MILIDTLKIKTALALAIYWIVVKKSKIKFFQEIFGHFLTSFQKQQKNIKVYATRVHCS
jgi:hypothetical protein